MGPIKFVACAGAGDQTTHVFVLDQAGDLWHTIRRYGGAWVAWGDVRKVIRDQGNPDIGPITWVTCTYSWATVATQASQVFTTGEVHVFALDQAGDLWHTIRRQDGSWPFPWGNVKNAVP